jgi:SAM-dependent methyltransferase
MQNFFDKGKLVPFQTSSGLDENYTGIYEGKVLRMTEKNIELFKSILQFSDKINSLITSTPFYEDKNIIVIQHERLENITYFEEWTKKQKVTAAKTVLEIQSKLSEKGFYLNDPHAFNITFKYRHPVYFDFGSITEGKIRPAWWFIKCFCGWTEMDYWDSVLKINVFRKFWLALRMFFSRSPYNYLFKQLSKFEKGFIEGKLLNIIKTKTFGGKATRKFISSLPLIFNNFSNWSVYEQKSPELNLDNDRTKNILELLNRYKPKKVLDIGANRGAYSLLALEKGAEEVIAIDLDNYSLDYLMNEVKNENKKVTIARLNIMSYSEKPGYYQTYLPAHERLNSDFTICLAVVHHICYFGNYSFEDFAKRLSRFAKKILIVEFVPYDDFHLTGKSYKGKDRSWYTLENFVNTMKKSFPGDHEIFDSTPSPRLLIKFCK